MKKRGISHIEVILSFIIFVGFVIFAFHFFSPLRTGVLIDSSLSFAFREIKNNVSIDVESYDVVMDVSCCTGGRVKIDLPGIDLEKDVRVENINGNVIDSQREGASGHVRFNTDDVYDTDSTDSFATFRYSDDFDDGIVGGGGLLDEEDYVIVSSEFEEFISEKRVNWLVSGYNSDLGYASIKESFNLPNRVNFGFSLIFDSGEIIEGQRSIPKGIDIFSDIERVEVLLDNGGIVFADLIVRIW